MDNRYRILIFGSTGMLGHTLFMRFSEGSNMNVFATARDTGGLSPWFAPEMLAKILGGVDADDFNSVQRAIHEVRPDIVINCVGIIKQLPNAKDPVISITINSLFPHQLAEVCKAIGARLIHISTDCVFAGDKGNYTESDRPDAVDLYGRSKLLGELDYPPCLTLRTSIIGHELKGKFGLIEWFLAQEGKVRGFTNAIYSGFPTVEMARIIADFVIPNPNLEGLYHVSSEPISKYNLLKLVAERYSKKIEIDPHADFVLDRSLNSNRFRNATGYRPPSWQELVDGMYRDYVNHKKLYGERPHY